MTIDLILNPYGQTYDITLSEEGDLGNGDFLDTSILYSIYGERRASESEVPISSLRRGWIGNEGKDFENGSKGWLFEQARRTQSNLNELAGVLQDSLSWLVDDGFLERVNVRVFLESGFTKAHISLYRFNSEVDHRYYLLWENTGEHL